MKARERAVTLFISFLNHKDDALKKTVDAESVQTTMHSNMPSWVQ